MRLQPAKQVGPSVPASVLSTALATLTKASALLAVVRFVTSLKTPISGRWLPKALLVWMPPATASKLLAMPSENVRSILPLQCSRDGVLLMEFATATEMSTLLFPANFATTQKIRFLSP